MTILLIGSGRLAKHLQYWNSLLQVPYHLLVWDRSQDPHLLKSHLQKASLVWLAISDSSLISFYEQHLEGLDISVVHFSGALSDLRMMCAHPLMSFPDELLPIDTYHRIFFGITGVQNLQDVLPGFKNEFFLLDAQSKPLYHALCVVAGNFPQMLWKDALKTFKNLNVPTEAVDIYIKQITDNFLSLKDESITGPFIRKDEETIEKNISALSTHSRLKNIYKTFMQEFYL